MRRNLILAVLVVVAALSRVPASAAAEAAPGQPPVAQAPPGPAPPPGQLPPPGTYYPPPPGYYPPPPGYYPPPSGYYVKPPDPGRQKHDGTYVRLFLGAGRIAMTESSQGSTLIEANGGGASFGVAVGGALVENLILYGEFYFMSADSPTLKVLGGPTNASGISLVTGGIGPGIAYYFQAINLYLSATVGVSKVQLQDSDTQDVLASTKWGFGFSTMLGKEFWVSDNWGLGGALQFHWGSIEDSNASITPRPTVNPNAIALVFSSTYN